MLVPYNLGNEIGKEHARSRIKRYSEKKLKTLYKLIFGEFKQYFFNAFYDGYQDGYDYIVRLRREIKKLNKR